MISPDFQKVWEVISDDKLNYAVEQAQEVFWARVTLIFPEVKTGDFTPDLTYDFQRACKQAIAWWLVFNHPALG